MLKEKFIRQIVNAERRPIKFAELHPETAIDLWLECIPPEPRAASDPPFRRPTEMSKDTQFMGVPLRANELVPRGEMWLRA